MVVFFYFFTWKRIKKPTELLNFGSFSGTPDGYVFSIIGRGKTKTRCINEQGKAVIVPGKRVNRISQFNTINDIDILYIAQYNRFKGEI